MKLAGSKYVPYQSFGALKINPPKNRKESMILRQFFNDETHCVEEMIKHVDNTNLQTPLELLKAVSKRQKTNPYDIVIKVGRNKTLAYKDSIKILLENPSGDVIKETDVYNVVEIIDGNKKTTQVVSLFETIINLFEKLANKYNKVRK